MAQVINTNIPSLNAQRNLNSSQSALATSLQRLSSGMRINSAKDDAAGLAISDRMTSQINGLNQAIRNANDGVSLAQTAEGALGSSSASLQRLRELAVQSANATNVSTDRASLNAEAQQLLAEIQRVATTTQFNGQNILDGSFQTAQFQVGANANQTISASIGNGQTSSLGAWQYINDQGLSPVLGTALDSGDLTINGVNIGSTLTGSADVIANAINSVSNQTSVTATATASIVAASTPVTGNQDLASGDLVINGVNIGAVTGSYNYATQGANIATAINAKFNNTGVTATANGTNGQITLTSTTGKTIAITSGSDAGASRVENATGLELTTSAATATQTYTLSASAGTSTGAVLAIANMTDGEQFTIGAGASLKTYQLVDSNGGAHAAVVNGGFYSGSSGPIAIKFDSTGNQANYEIAIKAAIGGINGNSDVTATMNGAGALTVTAKTLGVETIGIRSIDVAEVGGTTSMTGTITNASGGGIAVGSTLVIDNQTYTFIKGATSGNSVSLTQADTTALAAALAAAIDAQHSAALPASLNHSSHTATSGTNVVTTHSVLKGAAGNGAGTVSAGVVAGVGVLGADGTYSASTTYGTVSLSSNATFSIGGNHSDKAGLATASASLNAINAIDISSVQGANTAIGLIDGALAQVSTVRGALGALQNRFESTVSSLSSTSINLTAARSRIMDTDFASETASLTRNQILQQAGVAMLAQANALPNTVLSLLK